MPKQTVSMSLQEKDFDILERIRLTIGSERPLEYIDYTNKHDFGYTYKNQWRLLLFSKHICDSLNDIGMTPKKSLTLEFPDINPNLYRHFIRGYFDGDGTVGTNYSGLLSTKQFCQKVQNILFDELKINSIIYEASNHNGITMDLRLCKKETTKFLSWLYKDANLYLQRKYDRYIKYFCKNNFSNVA